MSDVRSGASRPPLEEQMGELMRAAVPPASLQAHLEGRARLIASVEKMRKPSRGKPALVAFAFAAAVAGAAGAALVVAHARTRSAPAAPIAWHVENGAASAQGYVSIPPTAPSARLVFDDGSDVALSPGSRGRVSATTPVGAEVVLEEGRARVHVQHRERTKWMVDAGPFAVRVTGTEFFVAWAAEAETMDVWMHSGRVEVTGPVIGDALTLSAGQHLRASLREKTVQIDGVAEPPELPLETAETPRSTPTIGTKAALQSGETAGSSPSLPTPGPSWSQLVSGGGFARVVREAEAEGEDHALASHRLGDLRALGDAARYAGNPALAKRAYAAIRSRFAASEEARTAAFLLGRVAEEQDHSIAEAGRWYDVYLAEAPGGAFAGDALGRKMVLVSKSQGREAAKPLASHYLQRFPGGSYAAAARDLSP